MAITHLFEGSIISESEYEWDGHTVNGVTYSDTRDGLGDYRIPKGQPHNFP